MAKGRENGFTLIELSIVLVIIGLLVGGVLVGEDLIKAAEVRATITQIEKFNTAANTFYGKYGYLPGDIPAAPAALFGFAARGQYAGEGDGNGVIEGNYGDCDGCDAGIYQVAGETIMFWADLSDAHLIDGTFSSASATTKPTSPVTSISIPSLDAYMPQAKAGSGNYVYVWSNASLSSSGGGSNNYFGLSAVSVLDGPYDVQASSPGLTVSQAAAIDKKIDDGLPQSGRVLAALVDSGDINWASVPTFHNNTSLPPVFTTATAGSSSTCFDNGNAAGVQQTYSLAQNNGAGVNCALSFQIQAGD